MKCLYCDKEINRYSLYSLFVEDDSLCLECRNKMSYKRRTFKIDDLKVEYFYDYDSLFKTILLQYKECYDEALKDVFLYRIDVYIFLKYLGYKIIYVPSSPRKIKERGFNHLKLIFEVLGFKEVQGLRMKEDLIQEGKGLKERKEMLDNYIYEGPYIDKILIVDDVCTTGSSLMGVYMAIKGHCRRAKALVLAKTK